MTRDENTDPTDPSNPRNRTQPAAKPIAYNTDPNSGPVPGQLGTGAGNPVSYGNDAVGVNTGGGGASTWANDPQYATMDPALRQIYMDTGQSPAGRGTGFADWQYWQGVGSSQYDRLRSDIIGNGPDQTTGTPWGAGAWQNSGRNGGGGAPGGSSGSVSGSVQNTSITTPTPTPLAAVTPFAASAYAPKVDPRADQVYNALMAKAGQSLDVNPNDPVIKANTDAYRAEQERGARNYLSDTAEAAGPYGTIGTEARMADEKAAQSTGAFQAQQMAQELGARRGEIMQALNGAAGFLTAQQQLALQDELAKLNVQLSAWQTKSTLDQQQGQFGQTLAQNADQFGRTLGQNESQFGRNLAQRAFEFDTNQDYLYSPFNG